jgi:hypothetical protein
VEDKTLRQNDKGCFDASPTEDHPMVEKCNGSPAQQWEWVQTDSRFSDANILN